MKILCGLIFAVGMVLAICAAGVQERASAAIAFNTCLRTTAITVQATAFDSFDRRSESSAAIAFSSKRPNGTLILFR